MAERQERTQAQQELLNRILAKRNCRQESDGRVIRVDVPGREINLAHVIGHPDECVYTNLGLDIGFHAGVVPEGDIGILHCSPWETTLIACDIAMKMGTVDIGFMDRFSGCVIITGKRADVISALEEITRFFREVLNIRACAVTHD